LTAGPVAGVPPRRSARALVTAGVAAGIIGVDQWTKSLAVADLANGPVHLVGPFSFSLSYNTGVAFSLGAGIGLPLIVLVVAVLALIIWFARGAPTVPAAVATGMIIGGALSNLADRVVRGHGGAVVDFIHSGFWPTFNVADAAITLGCGTLVVVLWRHGGRPPAQPGDEDHTTQAGRSR
jgi:signal peptidase II